MPTDSDCKKESASWLFVAVRRLNLTPAVWPRKLPIWRIAATSAKNSRGCAVTWNNFARPSMPTARLASGSIFCFRNSTAKRTPCCRNQPRFQSKTPAWQSKQRLRNCVNKCKMLNDLTKAEDSNAASATVGCGLLIVVSSPSGGGKGTLIDRVLKTVPGVSYSVSYTTRAPRGTEQDGREYFFISPSVFEAMVARGEFLEWANVYGYLYGTSAAQVERELEAGHDIILEIDVQGAASIRERIDDAVSIFIVPPSFELLRHRLMTRGTDSPADLERRLHGAPAEVEQHNNFQYVILNDDINRASQQLAAVISAERARQTRQKARLKDTLADFGVLEQSEVSTGSGGDRA